MPTENTPIAVSPALGEALDVIRGAGLPVMLVGTHGIGKSEYVEHFARQRGLVPYVLDLSLLEATDLTGMPYRDGGLTRFAPPATLPPPDSGPCMLVLEELNRCDRSVRQPCLQLLTTRRLNDYRLPEGCFLATCVNPDDHTYDVDVLDPALSSRFVILEVVPDRDAWLRWARSGDVHPTVVDFVGRYTAAFDKAPPRTWTHAAALLEAGLRLGREPAALEQLLARLLGPMTARALVMELNTQLAHIAPEDLLRQPAAYVRTFERWTKARQLDRVNIALDQLLEFLQRPERIPRGVVLDDMHRVLNVVPPDLGLPVLERLEVIAGATGRG